MEAEDFIGRYEAGLATQEWQFVSPLVHEDVCFTFSNGAFYKGKAEAQKAFEKNFALIEDEKYAISDIHWVRKSNQYAVFTYTFHWSGVVDGKLAGGEGRGTSVIVNREGKWLLLAEHLSKRL